MKQITLTLNHKELTVTVEEGETLLEMLRSRLGMTGTKKGCEVGECGACTVLVNDKPTASCIYLAAWAEGKEVLTIEGIQTDNGLSVIQEAFLQNGAVQCGFCTSGMILTAYSLLKQNPNLTSQEIKKGMSGNMCRCATYVQIEAAVKDAGRKMVNGTV